MDIKTILERQRKIYLDFFTTEIEKYNGAREVLLDTKNDEPEELFRLHRFDCLEIDNEGKYSICELNNDTIINHLPINYTLKNLNIELNPFFWNGCEIHYYENITDFQPIIEWGKKWIDIDDEKNCTNVIHNIQAPQQNGNEFIIAIDFGTADVHSILELFEILEKMGVKKIKVDSEAMLNQ